MSNPARILVLLASLGPLLFCPPARGQDSPPLGDVARQARQQKQKKAVQGKTNPSAAPKVITDDEIARGSEPSNSPTGASEQSQANSPTASSSSKIPGEQWKSQIQAQKDVINTLQANIQKVNDSIQYAPANCVSGCVQWNQHQEEKQKQVEQMRSQLETQKQRLQEMQESARQQGYGSSVYDP